MVLQPGQTREICKIHDSFRAQNTFLAILSSFLLLEFIEETLNFFGFLQHNSMHGCIPFLLSLPKTLSDMSKTAVQRITNVVRKLNLYTSTDGRRHKFSTRQHNQKKWYHRKNFCIWFVWLWTIHGVTQAHHEIIPVYLIKQYDTTMVACFSARTRQNAPWAKDHRILQTSEFPSAKFPHVKFLGNPIEWLYQI